MSFSEKPWIRVPLAELRTVPNHYIWFLLEGTPPINLTLVNTSVTLEGGFKIKGFQIKQTGTYKYTLLAENNEGSDSKTVKVTVLGKDSMLLNFIQYRYVWYVDILQLTTIVVRPNSCVEFCLYFICWWFSSFGEKWMYRVLVLFRHCLNTGNLCPFRFVNNTNLPKYNIGNLVWPLENNEKKWKFVINTVLMHISKRTAFLKIAPINCLILARFILQIAIIGVAVQVW